MAEIVLSMGVVVFAAGSLPVLWRSARELWAPGRVAAHTLGSIGVASGTLGMALLVLQLGDAGSAVALLLIKLALVLLLAFTRAVFRADARWAGVLLAGGALMMAASLALDLLALESGVVPAGSAAHTLGQIATSAPGLWLGVECALAWAQHRRRLSLGLSDPVLVNRFGLSAVAALSLVLICAATVAEGAGWVPVSASLLVRGLLHAEIGVLLVLIFSPPRAFTEWVAGRAAPMNGDEATNP